MSSAKVSKRPMTRWPGKENCKKFIGTYNPCHPGSDPGCCDFLVIMTSLRGESGAYTAYFFPKELTFNNYKRLFTETTLLNFPSFYKYADYFRFHV